MSHNDLPAFSGKCEGVVIDLPHSGRGCRLRPHPRRRNRRPDPVDTCAAAAPQWQYPALPVSLGSVLLPARRPLALHQLTARRAERAAIVQADYDKSIDPDQRYVKV
ncbi:hypothetical protein [Stenotrophomonas sp.]|uniref:hypothetical protein n=1 Tax=Stenotrophomonas sp. TaxID=69392 RepID=UPI002D6D7865|nr:hypothetical protein [Stenotrophomonas sp.]HYQ25013.1 hypothetical protein [Stenotrophomonas sp.]